MAKPRTRLDVSQKVLRVGDGYFFFFLPVAFAFFAFLATLPSAIPRLVQCKSTLDVHKYRVHTGHAANSKQLGGDAILLGAKRAP
jgi:hypothetical protein